MWGCKILKIRKVMNFVESASDCVSGGGFLEREFETLPSTFTRGNQSFAAILLRRFDILAGQMQMQADGEKETRFDRDEVAAGGIWNKIFKVTPSLPGYYISFTYIFFLCSLS